MIAEERGEEDIDSAAAAILDKISDQLTDDQHERALARYDEIARQIDLAGQWINGRP